jgi:hypothetical protein
MSSPAPGLRPQSIVPECSQRPMERMAPRSRRRRYSRSPRTATPHASCPSAERPGAVTRQRAACEPAGRRRRTLGRAAWHASPSRSVAAAVGHHELAMSVASSSLWRGRRRPQEVVTWRGRDRRRPAGNRVRAVRPDALLSANSAKAAAGRTARGAYEVGGQRQHPSARPDRGCEQEDLARGTRPRRSRGGNATTRSSRERTGLADGLPSGARCSAMS